MTKFDTIIAFVCWGMWFLISAIAVFEYKRERKDIFLFCIYLIGIIVFSFAIAVVLARIGIL